MSHRKAVTSLLNVENSVIHRPDDNDRVSDSAVDSLRQKKILLREYSEGTMTRTVTLAVIIVFMGAQVNVYEGTLNQDLFSIYIVLRI